jgi:uncharacterized protein YjiS (DUF1127 family)
MAMTDLDHKSTPRAPFGAITVFRASEAMLSGFDAVRRAFAASHSKADLAAFTPAQREDIGVGLAEVDAGSRGLGTRIIGWAVERRDRYQTVRALSSLTSAQLDDIGLSPADVEVYKRTGRLG